MVRIEGPGGFVANVSKGESHRVMVSGAMGDKAANFELKVNDEVQPVVDSLRFWLGFNKATERKLVQAILEVRANG